jgi:hypothetical protein
MEVTNRCSQDCYHCCVKFVEFSTLCGRERHDGWVARCSESRGGGGDGGSRHINRAHRSDSLCNVEGIGRDNANDSTQPDDCIIGMLENISIY